MKISVYFLFPRLIFTLFLSRILCIFREKVKASDSSEGPNAPSSSSPLASTDNAPPLSPSGDQAPPPSQPDTESCSPTNEEEEEDSDATSGKKRSSKKTSNSNRDKKGNSSNDNSSNGSGKAPLKSSHKNITSRATSRRLNLASDSPWYSRTAKCGRSRQSVAYLSACIYEFSATGTS